MTPAERKQLERKRKREAGLVLKQIWVKNNEQWEKIKDILNESK